MPKKKYPAELADPNVFFQRLHEYIKRRQDEVGKVHHWQIDEDFTWRWSNRVATEDLIRHYADAIGDNNPLWRNINYARNSRYGGIIAPPYFITCIAPTAVGDEPDDIPHGGMNAGCEIEWFKEVRPGDEFHGFDTWIGYEEKPKTKDRNYSLWIGTERKTYLNQRDEVVAIVNGHEVIMEIQPKHATDTGGLVRKVERQKYSDEEMEKLMSLYENAEKTRRGSQIRYWEDVVVGEEFGPVIQGPYDLMDVAPFMVVQGYMSYAFGIKWKRIWNHSRYTLDENNISMWEPHLRSPDGGPTANQGAQSEAGVCHLITNWMGDDGFLRKMSCQARRTLQMSQVSYIRGKVVKKYIDNGEHLVDLEINCTTGQGVMHMPATATVRFLSHEI
jgi:acyl dehydratase